jgi:hypothetical protein
MPKSLPLPSLAVPLAALLLSPFAVLAAGEAEGDFNGAWVAWQCPSGIATESGRCDNFVLEVFQSRGRLCGAHIYATAGAGKIDEGAPPSLSGSVQNGIANIVLQSGRGSPLEPPIRMQAELKLAKNRLQWRRLDNPPGDHLLPQSATLSRSRHGSLLNPFFEQRLRAVCAQISSASGGEADAIRNSGQSAASRSRF